MLKYMVSSRTVGSSSQVKPTQAVLDLLVEAGLMTARLVPVDLKLELTDKKCFDSSGDIDDIDALQITSQGFSFLLEERAVQIWQILMFFLQSAIVSAQDPWPSSLNH